MTSQNNKDTQLWAAHPAKRVTDEQNVTSCRLEMSPTYTLFSVIWSRDLFSQVLFCLWRPNPVNYNKQTFPVSCRKYFTYNSYAQPFYTLSGITRMQEGVHMTLNSCKQTAGPQSNFQRKYEMGTIIIQNRIFCFYAVSWRVTVSYRVHIITVIYNIHRWLLDLQNRKYIRNTLKLVSQIQKIYSPHCLAVHSLK